MRQHGVCSSLAPWFGCKRTLAPSIVPYLGPHRAYWEPFCGSMAVLFAKPTCSIEVVNDLHGDLVNLARTIQDRTEGPALYRRLRRVLCSEAEFRAALEVVRAERPHQHAGTDRAFFYFIASWQGMNGVSGTSSYNTNFARRFSSAGGGSGGRWRSAVNSIPQFRQRLERVQVVSGDGIDLCAKIEDREGTAIYVDPPYLVKGAKYLHDFASADHLRLAEVLARFNATRVVVSYYEHPDLHRLYPGWTRVRLRVAKSMVNSGMRDQKSRTEAPEVLLVNHAVGSGSPSLFDDMGAE